MSPSQDERWDGYLVNPEARFTDPDYGLLVNKVGARTTADLSWREGALSEARYAELREHPIPGRYDTAHMQAIHRHLFQDVYPWAGELRTVNMSKGYGPAFVDYPHVPVVVDGIADALRERDYLRGLDREHFVDTLAVVYNAVNTAHPFREGNGRTQRALWDQLAGRRRLPH